MLSEQQLTQFEEEGYLLLSGLIPQEIVTKAEAAMWQMMGMEAENPDSWGHFKRQPLAGFYMERPVEWEPHRTFRCYPSRCLSVLYPRITSPSLTNSHLNIRKFHTVKITVLMESGHSINSPFQLNGSNRRRI